MSRQDFIPPGSSSTPVPPTDLSTDWQERGAPFIECYGNTPETCCSFLTLCSLTFKLQPFTFATERSRVAFIITHLNGWACEWTMAEWKRMWLLFVMLWVGYLVKLSWDVKQPMLLACSGKEAIVFLIMPSGFTHWWPKAGGMMRLSLTPFISTSQKKLRTSTPLSLIPT